MRFVILAAAIVACAVALPYKRSASEDAAAKKGRFDGLWKRVTGLSAVKKQWEALSEDNKKVVENYAFQHFDQNEEEFTDRVAAIEKMHAGMSKRQAEERPAKSKDGEKPAKDGKDGGEKPAKDGKREKRWAGYGYGAAADMYDDLMSCGNGGYGDMSGFDGGFAGGFGGGYESSYGYGTDMNGYGTDMNGYGTDMNGYGTDMSGSGYAGYAGEYDGYQYNTYDYGSMLDMVLEQFDGEHAEAFADYVDYMLSEMGDDEYDYLMTLDESDLQLLVEDYYMQFVEQYEEYEYYAEEEYSEESESESSESKSKAGCGKKKDKKAKDEPKKPKNEGKGKGKGKGCGGKDKKAKDEPKHEKKQKEGKKGCKGGKKDEPKQKPQKPAKDEGKKKGCKGRQ